MAEPDPRHVAGVVVKRDRAVLLTEGAFAAMTKVLEDLVVIAQVLELDSGVAGREPDDGEELVDQVGVHRDRDAAGDREESIPMLQRSDTCLLYTSRCV